METPEPAIDRPAAAAPGAGWLSILHICTDFWPSTGGIERFVLALCRNSPQQRLRPGVLCLNRIHTQPGILPARARAGGADVHRVPFINLTFYKPAMLPVSALRRADVIHVHGVGALLDWTVATRALHGRPIVVSTHGGIFHTRRLLRLKRAYFNGVQPRVLRRASAVVASSQSDLALFQGVAPRTQLIENGVETERFSPGADAPAREPARFAYVGRLSRNKRVDLLIDAFAALAARGALFKLRIVGPDWEGLGAGLRRRAQQAGLAERIAFVGEATDAGIVDELQRAEFFVSASEYEGFGISAIEAMAAGAIPLLQDISPFEHLLGRAARAQGIAAADESPCGALLDFAQPGAAAGRMEMMMRMAAGARESIRRAAMRRAAEYSWRTKMPEWRAVYDAAAQSARPRAGRRALHKGAH